MLINEYAVLHIYKTKEAELRTMDHHHRALADIISEFKAELHRRPRRRRRS